MFSQSKAQASNVNTAPVRQDVLDAAVTPLLESLEVRSMFSAAPTANPGGPYSVAEGQSVTIRRLASTDGDGTVASYQWDTNYSVSRGFRNRVSSPTWTFTADDSGTRTIALKVTDNSGDVSNIVTTQINVSDVAPTLTLTLPGSAQEASPVNITWSHTDPGLSDTVTAWNVDWGDDTDTNYAGSATGGTHVYDSDGTYTVTLTATQTDATTSITQQLVVSNVPPIVNVSTNTQTIDEGARVKLNFASPNRASTLDGWLIDWGDGQQDVFSKATSQALHLYTDSGSYTATVYAQEPDGGSGSATQAFTVNNVAPTVTHTGVPSTGVEGTAITIGSTVADPGIDDTHSYGWTVYKDGANFVLPGGTNDTGTSFTFTPTDNGSYVVRLTVVDDEGASKTVNSPAISVANAAPTAVVSGEPVGSIAEGTAVNLTVAASDVGTLDTFTYGWSVAKGGSAFALPNGTNTTGTGFGFTPTDNGSYVATVVVSDKDGDTVSVASTAITVTNVAPVAGITGAPASGVEGSAISVSANPTDAGTADTFSYAWVVVKDGQTYTLPAGVNVAGSTFAFTPTDNGSYEVELTVTDDDGATDTIATNPITVTNAAPTATISNVTTGVEGSALNLNVVVVDAGSDDTHTYLWTVEKDGQAYNLNGATDTADSFTFTPEDNGTYVVSVLVTDNDNAGVTVTRTITVANALPVPTITGAPASGNEGTSISLGSTVTDAGVNDTHTYAWTVKKDNVAVDVSNLTTNGTSFTFTPADNGNYVVTLAVTDNDTGTASVSTSAIVVANVDPTAVVTGEPGSTINEGDDVGLTATASDAGTDTFSYAWTIKKDGQAWTPASGTTLNAQTLNFVPTDNGSYVATVIVTDDDNGSVSVASSAVVVDNVDPTAGITAPATAEEGDALSLTSTVTDAGVADTHSYLWSVKKDNVAVDLTGLTTTAPGFNFTPADNGAYVVTLVVIDDDNGTVTTTSNIAVTNVAPAPTISGNASVDEGQAITLNVAANDAGTDDTHTYLWSVTKAGSNYTTDLGATNAAAFTFTPNLYGSYVVSVTVTDSDNAAATVTKTITVNNVAPSAAITGTPNGSVVEGSLVSLNGTSGDVSGENGLTYAWTVKRGNATFALPNNAVTDAAEFEFTPTDNGAYKVTLAVTDSGGLSTAVTTSNIVVTNAAPTATLTGAPASSITEGTAVSLHVAAADAGADDMLGYAWTVTKNGLAYTLPEAVATETADLNFTPNDNGTYVATCVVTDDDSGLVSVNSGAMVVTNVAPTAVLSGAPIGSVDEGAAISFTATATDPGPTDTIQYSWAVMKDGEIYQMGSDLGTSTNSFSFTPTDNGSYVVKLFVTDGLGGNFYDTAAITVANVAPAGTIAGPTTADEGSAVTITATASDAGEADELGYAWTVTKNGDPLALPTGTVADADSLDFTPTDEGTYVFTCVVIDDDNGSVTLTHELAVANVAPTVTQTGVPETGVEGTAITVGSTAADPGDDTLTYAWSVYKNGQLFTLPNGTVTSGTGLTFTPTDNGKYVVRLSVNDGTETTTVNSDNVTVANAAPQGSISGDSAVDEGTKAEFTGSATDVGTLDTAAGFTYAWKARRGNSVVATGDEQNFSFTPSVHGEYGVELVVTDKDGGTTTTHSALNVANVAPKDVAIEGELDGYDEGDSVHLVASAKDVAGDNVSLAWKVMYGEKTTASGTGSNVDFTATRGHYSIVVTATDTAGATATDSFDLDVANVAPAAVLASGQDGSVMVGSQAVFGLMFDDVPLDQAMDVSWEFGDGSKAFNSYTGGSTVTKKHAYATHGTYTVTAIVSDGQNQTTVTTTVVVSEAAMITDPMDPRKTALLVAGGDGNDTIAVTQLKNGRYAVDFNGDNLGNNFAPTGRIYVYGNGGSNTITVSGPKAAVVFAGDKAGNVSTGSGNDIIVGTAGNDRLNAGDGRDVVIGMAGADILRGNEGDDLIISGAVAKTDTASLAQLTSKWADGNGSASARRNSVLSLFNKKSLIADSGGNQLYGDAGNDWFVIGSDKLKDLQKTDLVN